MSTEQKASFLDILHLTSQAWDAYYQKRTRECLALAKALQQADPDNTEARSIQTAVRSDLQKDINDARILLESSGDSEEIRKHRKTAEVMLLKVIYLDPENKEAKVLLSAAKAMQGGSRVSIPPAPAPEPVSAPREITPVPALASIVSTAPTRLETEEPVVVKERVAVEMESQVPMSLDVPPTPAPTPVSLREAAPEMVDEPYPVFSNTVPAPAPTPTFKSEPEAESPLLPAFNPAPAPVRALGLENSTPAPLPKSSERADTFFVAQTPTTKKTNSNSRSRVPFIFGTIVVVIAALIVSRYMQTRGQNTTKPAAPAASYSPAPVASPPPPPVEAWTPAPVIPPTASAPLPKPNSASVSIKAPAPVAYAPVAIPTAVVENGSLAVSSPTAAEIYQGDKLLGSTPTTLQFPAGTYTLEYRHDNLRTTVTHVIKANQTTTALVTFDTVVQINARPWAQVYIDGAQRQALGQTPLSNVRVPIGKNLIFENPNFPAKTYRVTGNEKAIQIIFP